MSSQNSDIDDSIFTLEYGDAVPNLSKAAKVGDLKTVKELLANGSLPQAPDNRGWTAIHCCVFFNQFEVLKLILKLKSKNKKYLVNLLTWENESPLIIAVKSPRPSIDMVKLLLESGADPNHSTHTKITPLHMACRQKGNLNIVKLLIHYGADVNSQECVTSCTPLHYAVSRARDLDTIKYMINLCDLKLVNDDKRCAFLEACYSNFLEAVEIFIENDKNFVNFKSDLPPLVYACLSGNIKMAELFINSNADVHCRCKAVIFSKPGDLDFYFDREDFFPVHSSLSNIEIFTLLLKFTNPEKLLQLETNYYNFPLFVLLFGGNDCFFETLMQSDLPAELKKINCRVLINFVLRYPHYIKCYALKSFHLMFKYNFYLEPENVFQNFACLMTNEEVCEHFKFFHLLAQMGISSEDEFENKKAVVRFFDNFIEKNNELCEVNILRCTCDLLSESVLTLKQYCRIAVRRKIKAQVSDDWLAYKMIRESTLPECLKKFLFFEQFL